jgi:hypothetical protein
LQFLFLRLTGIACPSWPEPSSPFHLLCHHDRTEHGVSPTLRQACCPLCWTHRHPFRLPRDEKRAANALRGITWQNWGLCLNAFLSARAYLQS